MENILKAVEISINLLIALSAVLAFIISLISLYYTRKFKEDERNSRRGYLAPKTKAGFFKPSKVETEESFLGFYLENYGQNPISNVRISLSAIVTDHNSNKENKFNIGFSFKTAVNNPIPNAAEIITEVDRDSFPDLTSFNASFVSYFIMDAKYSDLILLKEFSERFYWSWNKDGILTEVNQNEIGPLKLMTIE